MKTLNLWSPTMLSLVSHFPMLQFFIFKMLCLKLFHMCLVISDNYLGKISEVPREKQGMPRHHRKDLKMFIAMVQLLSYYVNQNK